MNKLLSLSILACALAVGSTASAQTKVVGTIGTHDPLTTSFTVSTLKGKVQYKGATLVHVDGTAATAKELVVGAGVTVEGTQSSTSLDFTATKVTVPNAAPTPAPAPGAATWTGTVEKPIAGNFYLKDSAAKLWTVKYTSTTKITDAKGTAVPASQIVAGKTVTVGGTVSTTTIAASTITLQ